MSTTLDHRPEPAQPAERILTLDILRGCALLGILVVNMLYFSSPYMYTNLAGIEWWSGIADRVTYLAIHFLAEGKFISMFSLLFGMGMALHMERSGIRGYDASRLQLRRLLILLVIGLLHAVLVWNGDVLTLYALLGLILLLLQNQPPAHLAKAGIIVLVIPVALAFLAWGLVGSGMGSPDFAAALETDQAAQRARFTSLVEASIAAYQQGTYGDILQQRLTDLSILTEWSLSLVPLPLGLFLLGYYAGRRGVHRSTPDNHHLLRRLTRWGLALGLLGNGVTLAVHTTTGVSPLSPSLSQALYVTGVFVGAPALAVFYAAGIALLCQEDRWRRFLSAFAPVGRMALTHYLAQSAVATTIFYAYGLALYGRVALTTGLILALLIFGVQMAVSPWWLRRYRFGPMEWLWRSLTYGYPQPMIRQASPSQSSHPNHP